MSYPQETNWSAWLAFDTPAHAAIDPVFRGRLAAYVRDVIKRKVAFAAGFRSRAEQQALYDRYKAGSGNLAAAPGTSWHEFRCAVDVHGPGTNWPEIQKDYHTAPVAQMMRTYGLVIPLWAGSKAGNEWWHIQPIETIGYTGTKAAFLMPDDMEEDMLKAGDNSPAVGSWQMALDALGVWPVDVKHNMQFGPTTTKLTNEFKTKHGLPADGTVDDATWGAMTDALRAKLGTDLHACQALESAQAAELVKLRTDLGVATSRISAAKQALG